MDALAVLTADREPVAARRAMPADVPAIVDEAPRRDRALVQLTTDKTRASGAPLLSRHGFVASHEGMKLAL